MNDVGIHSETIQSIDPADAAREKWDVVIVGAGPAGSAAAIELARRGRRVILIDREAFPRDKSCGDGITRSGVTQLDYLGVLPALAGQQEVRGARVHMRERGHRDFPYENASDYGLVVPRLELDACLLRKAVSEGAAFLPRCRAQTLMRDDEQTITGVEITTAQNEHYVLQGYTIIAADGAASRLARDADLRPMPEQGYGTALRGYVECCADTPALLELMLPLRDVTDRFLLPSYGWCFPTGKGTANVGVGLFCREFDANVHVLFDQFLDTLRSDYPDYRDIRLAGPTLGAPLRFDFAPERAAVPGLLLVGDAAGLISPFTGEGISFALESGVLAAETIDRCLRTGAWPSVAAENYALLLGDRFAGYFTLGSRASRRYEFIWRVLDDTFDSEKPVHNLLRRAVLVPEGTGEDMESAMLDDVSTLVRVPEMPLGEDLRAVGARLNKVLREDWPFLSRMSLAGRRTDMVAFRPSLLFLLTSYLGETDSDARRAAATSLELAYLGFLAQSGVRGASAPSGAQDADKANWGDKLAILTGDYLLAKSHEVGAADCAGLVPKILSAMASTCQGRVAELQTAWQPDLEVDLRVDQMRHCMAGFFRLPCELGAALAGRDDLTALLGQYGENVGLSYLMTEEELSLERTAGSTPFASELTNGVFGIPFLRGFAISETARAAAVSFRRNGDLIKFTAKARPAAQAQGCGDLGRLFRDEAKQHLDGLPQSTVSRSLSALADYAYSREVPDRPVLQTVEP